MNTNINRHSFTDFTAKPYIYYHGVPYTVAQNVPQYDRERTVIRTNQPNKKIIHSAANDRSNFNHCGAQPNLCDDSWSNFVRKDNMYARYAANC